MEGLPIVPREEGTFREIAALYGRVIEPFDFSWGNFDVSSASCLVEGRMDLEEGEFRPNDAQNLGELKSPVTGHPELRGEVKSMGQMGEAEGLHSLHGDLMAAHDMGENPCIPRNSLPKADSGKWGSSHVGPDPNLGLFTGVSSRKRPRNRRSPVSIDSPSGPLQSGAKGHKFNIPPFPDLNNPTAVFPGSPDDSSSFLSAIPVDIMGTRSTSKIPKTQPVGDPVDLDKEVADTIEVGIHAGIQVEEFGAHVRSIIKGEGASNRL
ncbi:hypothetical protein L1987_82281 [Smallanthus sonchifolius]|uniref:Uncharacterized protein n=1 Tax=Smallanthus sonchifolius TaxID=185202 RepID=A0ACB8YAW0_9ASTR|nr:hypothetical protein L1987_82281 [Smallanthus sonchifolius]